MLYSKAFIASSFLVSSRLDFKTHLKYVALLARLSHGLSVFCTVPPLLKTTELPQIKDKTRLIDLTHQSVRDENAIVQIDDEYSTAAVLWLPIKTYYLTYHLLCIIAYLLVGKSSLLRAKHGECVEHFSKMLSDGTLQFSEPLFNQVFDKSILNFRTSSGEHLRGDVPDDVVYKLIMKKTANEKIASFKLSRGIADARNQKNRQKVERFQQSMTVSIFDFFYQMRLRLNYRNFNFIDHISARETKAYFDEYFATAECFYDCFVNLKNKLVSDISVEGS